MPPLPLIVDAHLDLATNAMTLNRDLTRPVHEIRARELALGLDDYPDRGHGTVALPELRRGGVGLVFATLIARYSATGSRQKNLALPGWHSPAQAYASAQGQLAWYREMERLGEMVQISDRAGLERHLELWRTAETTNALPVGYVLALEGADSIVTLDHLHQYYAQGLRSVGLAHFGPGRYAAGTNSDGSGLTAAGRELVREMNTLNMLLDVTHLTDRGFYEALELYTGPLLASHQNCRALVPGERQFSDAQLRAVIERGGVVGGALDAWMLQAGYVRGQSPRALGIGLERIIDHYDHVCQLAGNADHIAIGSDLDGLFGTEQSPYDLDTVADLQRIGPLLRGRGYTEAEVEQVLSGNWLLLLAGVLAP
ncbi:hypothetical protein LEM8419_00860 [Neolewinella maritima]|uniref:Peptidase M19 n=1 Tax=Neolewinella maritima TaxID=1383882 RepID=A0ABN8F0P3_9BACT|nr:membrane dipeptidase [Neolewinella maritima]CAH0999560.1 hypothetical protein LEM8419_00860 [Neolewinella maritima]